MGLNAQSASWTLRPLPEGQAETRGDLKDREAQGPRKYRASIAKADILDRDRLEETAGTPQSWKFDDFVRAFLLMLPYRADKVRQALAAGDWGEARLAAQSLSWSASMAGACRLELIAGLIDADLQSGRHARARETARVLRGATAELEAAITRLSAG